MYTRANGLLVFLMTSIVNVSAHCSSGLTYGQEIETVMPEKGLRDWTRTSLPLPKMTALNKTKEKSE